LTPCGDGTTCFFLTLIPHNPGSTKETPVTKVTVREGETADRAIKRFKRKVEQAGILKEVRKREHYLKPSVKAKLKARAAEARARKREKRLLLNTGV
jgi:small subunit ribosomal protein S21